MMIPQVSDQTLCHWTTKDLDLIFGPEVMEDATFHPHVPNMLGHLSVVLPFAGSRTFD